MGMSELSLDRTMLARRGMRLEYFTIAWNSVEGLVGIVAGALAGSISLVGFGVDSIIEVTSGAAVLWRMSGDGDACNRDRRERRALQVVGVCFLALSVYVAYESIHDLIARRAAASSLAGILLAVISLMVMPLLARAKRRVGRALQSAAMRADAKQTEFCVYLSAILLAGLLLNAVWGLWWADPVAALAMAPIIAAEGVKSLRGQPCCD